MRLRKRSHQKVNEHRAAGFLPDYDLPVTVSEELAEIVGDGPKMAAGGGPHARVALPSGNGEPSRGLPGPET